MPKNRTKGSPVYRKIARSALLTALCVALGYLFLPIPNVEMITLGIFLSGMLMGSRLGALIGFLAETIYSVTNPMGFPPPPLLLAQVASMSLIGCAGGFAAHIAISSIHATVNRWTRRVFFAVLGAALTFVFDFATNLSFPLSAGFTHAQVRAALIIGISYMAIHVGTNAIAFAVLIPILINRLANWSQS